MPDLERNQAEEEVRQETQEEIDGRAKFITGFMKVVGETFSPVSKEITKRMSDESRRTLDYYSSLCMKEKEFDSTMTELENQEKADPADVKQYFLAKTTRELMQKQKENIETKKLGKIYDEFTEALFEVVGKMGGNEAQQFIFNQKVYDIFKDPKFDAIPLSKKDEILKNLLAKASNIDPADKEAVKTAYKNWSGNFSKDEEKKETSAEQKEVNV